MKRKQKSECGECHHSMGYHNEKGCAVQSMSEDFCACTVTRSMDAPKLELEQAA